jgi:hypothetical protein
MYALRMDSDKAGDSAGNLAEVVARLVECGAVRLVVRVVVQIGDPTAGGANSESRDASAPAVNGPPLLRTDGKVAAEVHPGVGVGGHRRHR